MFGIGISNQCTVHGWSSKNSMYSHCPWCNMTNPTVPNARSEYVKTGIIDVKEQQVTALKQQVDGNHYKDLPIQPVEYIHANALGYFEGNVIKYISRWRKKNGLADLLKAKHYIELLIELEGKKSDGDCNAGKTN